MRKKLLFILALFAFVGSGTVWAQENLQQQAKSTQETKTFMTVKELPITSIKNQWRSGTCWAYGTLGYLESEILRQSGRKYNLCEMFVVNKDYMDNATHFVRMHGFSQISQGGSCDDVLDVIRRYGICPEEAMPAPGSLVGDSLANFTKFFPDFESTVRRTIVSDDSVAADLVAAQIAATTHGAAPRAHWQDSVQAVLDRYVGHCPESFTYEGKTYTPHTFAQSLGLAPNDYVSLTSYTHHPFREWFVIEAPYKWRLKSSYNIPIDELMDVIDKAIDAGYTVAWGGDVSGDFTRTGMAELPNSVKPTQQLRQEQWNDWRFTYDHVMLIYGKAIDEVGRPYYMVKNTWGKMGKYQGVWYMSRDYMILNTTYIFLNRHALPKSLRKAVRLLK